jgi:hypothetical protein
MAGEAIQVRPESGMALHAAIHRQRRLQRIGPKIDARLRSTLDKKQTGRQQGLRQLCGLFSARLDRFRDTRTAEGTQLLGSEGLTG